MPSLEWLHRRDSYFVRHVRYFISLYTTRFACVALHVHTWERAHRIQVKLLQTILSILLLDSASHVLVAQGGRCWNCNKFSVNCTVFMHHRICCFFHLLIFLSHFQMLEMNALWWTMGAPHVWMFCGSHDLCFIVAELALATCGQGYKQGNSSGRGTATGCLPWLPILHPEQKA